MLRDAWTQCQDADVLIERYLILFITCQPASLLTNHDFADSPSAMAGVHIAEALGTLISSSLSRTYCLIALSHRHTVYTSVHHAVRILIHDVSSYQQLTGYRYRWTRTTAYPHAFLSPPVELSGSLNYST